MAATMTTPLDPRPLRAISPKLATIRFISRCVPPGVVAVACLIAALIWQRWYLVLAAAVAIVVTAWIGWLVPRQVRGIGYLVDDTDLVVASGMMFRSLTSVPMGRLQYLEIERGPLEKRWGLATLTLHTASATTNASIPGLTNDEAVALRETLSQRGGAHLQGL
ncbi:PH domain-containing protein [Nanchangia anserum]|uniref:PH domain-containing protein n=1 Tax=Nanchangia anserum TaxID=2692125 RepID=A0A8I0GA91_9ACTO|nr:PH domain-containing protein [Nanchangia anserum]MBD3690029.1 PH domain-containing protein [Nanchangia anserum]QOX82175.1 PH domain-containing protein [Nanchangia anserum]